MADDPSTKYQEMEDQFNRVAVSGQEDGTDATVDVGGDENGAGGDNDNYGDDEFEEMDDEPAAEEKKITEPAPEDAQDEKGEETAPAKKPKSKPAKRKGGPRRKPSQSPRRNDVDMLKHDRSKWYLDTKNNCAPGPGAYNEPRQSFGSIYTSYGNSTFGSPRTPRSPRSPRARTARAVQPVTRMQLNNQKKGPAHVFGSEKLGGPAKQYISKYHGSAHSIGPGPAAYNPREIVGAGVPSFSFRGDSFA